MSTTLEPNPQFQEFLRNARNINAGAQMESQWLGRTTVYSGDSLVESDTAIRPVILARFPRPNTVLFAPRAPGIPDAHAHSPYDIINFRDPQTSAENVSRNLKGPEPLKAYLQVGYELIARTALLPDELHAKGAAAPATIEDAFAEYVQTLSEHPAAGSYDAMLQAALVRFTMLTPQQLTAELNAISALTIALNNRMMDMAITSRVAAGLPTGQTIEVITPVTPPHFHVLNIASGAEIIPFMPMQTTNHGLTDATGILFDRNVHAQANIPYQNAARAFLTLFDASDFANAFRAAPEPDRVTPPPPIRRADEPIATEPAATGDELLHITRGNRGQNYPMRGRADARSDRDEVGVENEKGFNPLQATQLGIEWLVTKPFNAVVSGGRKVARLFSKKKSKEAAAPVAKEYNIETTMGGVELRSKYFNRHIATIERATTLGPDQRTLEIYNDQPEEIYGAVQRLRREARICGNPTTILLEPLIIAAGIRLFTEQNENFNPFDARMDHTLNVMRRSLAYDPTRPAAWKGIPEDSEDLERVLLLTRKLIEKVGNLGPAPVSGKPARVDVREMSLLKDIAKDYVEHLKTADRAYIARMMRGSLNSPREDVFYVKSPRFANTLALVTEALNSGFDDPFTKTTAERRAALRKAKAKIDIQRAQADQIVLAAEYFGGISKLAFEFKEIDPAFVVSMRAFFSKAAETKTVLKLPFAGAHAYYSLRGNLIGKVVTALEMESAPTIPESRQVVHGIYLRLPLSVATWLATSSAELAMGNYIYREIIKSDVVAGIAPALAVSILTYVAMNLEVWRGETPASLLLPDVKPATRVIADVPSWSNLGITIADAALASNAVIYALPSVLVPLGIQLLNDRKTRLKFFEIMQAVMISSVAETDGAVGEALAAWGYNLRY